VALVLSARQVAGEPQQGRARAGEVGWHGKQPGRVHLKERKLRVQRPRLRKKGRGVGREVPVPACEARRQDTTRLIPPAGSAVFVVPRDFRQDMVQMWNFSVQRQLGWNIMAEVAYVGTRGSHLYRNRNINVPLPGPGPIQERRPFFSLAPAIPTIQSGQPLFVNVATSRLNTGTANRAPEVR
jgi:hypothetical protein